MGTAGQIKNIGDCCFPRPLILRLNAHSGCHIEDKQQEQVQLTMEGEKTYTVC